MPSGATLFRQFTNQCFVSSRESDFLNGCDLYMKDQLMEQARDNLVSDPMVWGQVFLGALLLTGVIVAAVICIHKICNGDQTTSMLPAIATPTPPMPALPPVQNNYPRGGA